MADAKISEPELVGVRPGVIAFFMTIITLIAPLGFFTSNIIVLLDWYIGPGVFAVFWAYGSTPGGLSPTPFHVFSIPFLKMAFTLGIFNLFFLIQIIRYYQGKVSRRNVLLIGLISLVFPTLFAFVSTAIGLPLAIVGIVLPIPIQFIAGMIFMFKLPGPELEQIPV